MLVGVLGALPRVPSSYFRYNRHIMNRIQRWIVRLTTRLVPQLRQLFESAGGTMERLQEQVTLYREDYRERRAEGEMRAGEIREAIAMQQGMWGGGQSRLQESIQPASKAVVVLKERLAELELALEDRGWRRQIAMSDYEFSRWGIQQIILISRLFRIKNPLIQRGILVSAYYVFGRGVEVTSEDDAAEEVLNAFFTDPRNLPHIGHSALVAKEASLYTDGNIFWCFHTDIADGQTLIRTIDPLEIDEIICDPDDSSVPWYYHRRWTQQTFDPATGIRNPKIAEAWYVALGYTPEQGVTKIKDIPLAKDGAGQLIPILHRKDGALEKWTFGCPRVYAAIDWARASKDLLTDYAGRMRALSRFAWDLETKGGPGAIANFKQTFATTLVNDGSMLDSNPSPESNSTWITGPGTKLTPMKTQGAATGPDEGRRLFHMVYMVFGLGEHFFSDINSGNLATATSLDRPTELKFLNDQEGWREDLKRIGSYVLERSAKAPKGKLREAGKTKTASITVNVNFPPIVEGDIPQLVTAAVSALTLNGYPAIGVDEKTGMKTLLSLLAAFSNVEIDVEKVIEAMYPDGEYKADRNEVLAAKKDQTLNPPPPPAPGAPPNGAKPKPSVKEAVALFELRKAVTALKANGHA